MTLGWLFPIGGLGLLVYLYRVYVAWAMWHPRKMLRKFCGLDRKDEMTRALRLAGILIGFSRWVEKGWHSSKSRSTADADHQLREIAQELKRLNVALECLGLKEGFCHVAVGEARAKVVPVGESYVAHMHFPDDKFGPAAQDQE